MNHDSMPLPASAGGFWLMLLHHISQWLSGNGYAPHSGCFLGDHLWVSAYVTANWVISLAYTLISLLIWQRMQRAAHIPRTLMGNALLGIFVTCAGGHFLAGITTVLWPGYRFETLWHWMTTVPAWIFLAHHKKFSLIVEGPHMIAESREELSRKNGELNTLYEQVKEVDRLKSEFFANVSHELRTPLTLILGPISNTLAGENLTDAQRRDLEVAARNARTVLKHVNDLLDIARMEAGKMRMHYAEVDLAQTARVLASHFEAVVAERSLTFELDTPETLTAQVDGDKIQRVLLNLFSNAVKFVPAGGRIVCRLATEDSDVIMEVQDNGPGVPEDMREAIFERFRQVDASSTRQHEGTGLGLAIVKDFIELHEGRIELSEAPGGGALFHIRLPLFAPTGVDVARPDAQTTVAQDDTTVPNANGTTLGADVRTETQRARDEVAEGVSAEAPGGVSAWSAVVSQPLAGLPTAIDNVMIQTLDELRAREEAEAVTQETGQPLVLVVEDNREMSRFIAQTLAPSYRAAQAYNGAEGLERALELRPDLILSDIMMPGKSGDQMVEELRTHAQLDDTPILLLTAKADDDLRVRLLRSGAQDYLMKPFAPEELRARVTNLVTMKRARQTLQAEVTAQQQNLETLAVEVTARKRALQTALEDAQTARHNAEQAREDAQRHERLVEQRNAQLLVAIQEAHHRIKNNLQKVSALIEMELDDCGGASVPAQAVRARLYQIKAIAIVHDLLTQHTDFNEVDAADALRRLVHLLQANYRSVPGALSLHVEADTLIVPAKVGISLALIVTELVSNAQQYGQPVSRLLPNSVLPSLASPDTANVERSQESGTQHAIRIQLRHRDGEAVLIVTDPGPGFAPGFRLDRDACLGLELVRTLVESDLQGRIEVGAATAATEQENSSAGAGFASAASNGSERNEPAPPAESGRDARAAAGRVAITFPERPDAA